MAKPGYEEPPLAPMIVLLILTICLCVFMFWLGTVCVRLWLYNGALGPEATNFIIIPRHRKERQKLKTQSNISSTVLSHILTVDKRATVFPHIAFESSPTDPFTDDAHPASQHAFEVPTITIENTEDDEPDLSKASPEQETVRKLLNEERRISRLPAFEQDDCGDGSRFPDIPFASRSTTIRKHPQTSSTALQETRSYLSFGLKTIAQNNWLSIDNTYIEQWEARTSLLREKNSECVHVTRDGEEACEELLGLITDLLGVKYPEYFSSKTKSGKKYIRCDLTGDEYVLEKPMTYKPLEVCARLCAEDLNVFVRDEFTLCWYLQASATCFPSGYRISKYIGKSLNTITNDILEPMVMWEDLLQILNTVHSTPNKTFTKTTTYIQTRPASTSLPSTLHITRPMDFFAGTTHDLHPYSLTLRRETETFKVLARTGAVVMAVKTELKELSRLDEGEKRELMKEIEGWDEEEAVFKGRDLWIRAVSGWCLGRAGVKDDVSVVDAGGLTRIGD